ncbi:MAG: glycosyltransferase family 39 protein [Thermoproteota archaeon]
MLTSIKQSLILTPLLGLTGLVWLFILGTSIFGGKAGFIGAFLWAVNPLFIWFSRYANAEILMFVFTVAGIWGLAEAAAGKSFALKVFAFICLGLATLTKIEALLLVVPLIVASWVISWGKREIIVSLSPFVALYGWSWLHALTFSRSYLLWTFTGVTEQIIKFSLTNLALYSSIILGAVLFFVLFLKGKRKVNLLMKIAALIWAVAGLIGYMLPLSLGIPAGFVPWGWFMSPALVLLASIGPLIIADDMARSEASKTWVLFVFAGFFVMLSARFAMYGDYPWGARRTISGAMPLFTLVGSYPLSKGIQHSKGLLKIGFVILLIAIIISCLPLDVKFLKHSEYGSAIETLESFAAVFPENSIIIFEGSLPGSWLSLPLAFQKGQLPLVFWLDQPSMPTVDFEAVQEVVRKAEAFGMPVYLVTIENYDLTGQGCEFRLIKTFDLEVPTFEFLNYNGPPLNNKTWQFTLYIYRASGPCIPNDD